MLAQPSLDIFRVFSGDFAVRMSALREECSVTGERFWNGHRSNIGVEKLS